MLYFQLLKDQGVLHFPINVASNIIMSLRPSASSDGPPRVGPTAITNYETLIELGQSDMLDFSLEEVVKQLVTHFLQGAVE